jgi:hypothetical protein
LPADLFDTNQDVMPVFCTKCGTQNEDFSQNCSQCGAALPVISGRPSGKTDYAPPYEPTYQPIQPPGALYSQSAPQDWQTAGADKKIIAGLLAICSALSGSINSSWVTPRKGSFNFYSACSVASAASSASSKALFI